MATRRGMWNGAGGEHGIRQLRPPGKSTSGYHKSGIIPWCCVGSTVASHALSMEALNLTLIVLRPLHLA
jgi:hypothetical protein